MATLDDLSIKIGADTADFQVGAEGVENSLDDISTEAIQTAASMQILQGRTDEAGDEMTQLSAKAGVASAGLSTLSNTAFGTQVAFLGLSVATTASLIPALVALSAAIAPIVGALGGFITLAAAIGGVGLAGAIGAIATNTELFKNELQRVAGTLQEAFGPLIQEARTVLLLLIRDFEDLIPALAPSQEAIDAIGQNFLALGRAILDLLPAFMELATTLATEFLPGFVEFVEDVGPELPEILMGLVETFDELLPQLLRAGELLIEFLPVFTEFGFTVLDVLGPALTDLTQGLTNVFNRINNLSDGFGRLVASGSLLAPVLIGLVSLLGGPLSLAVAGIVGAVYGLARAFQTNFANIRTYLTGLWGQFQRIMPQLRGAIQAFLSGVDFASIAAEVDEFEQALGTQLMSTLEALKPVFGDLQTLLQENQEEFEIIGEAVGTLFEAGINLATAFVNILYPAIRDFVIPAIRAGIDALDFMIDKLARTIELTQAINAGNFGEATDIALEATGQQAEFDRTVRQLNANQSRQEEFNQRVEVVVEGDTDLVRNVSAEVVNQESRQQRRNNGSPTGL